MAKYDLDFEYLIPEFGTITGIVADTEEEARELALAEIEPSYPEAQEVLITAVRIV